MTDEKIKYQQKIDFRELSDDVLVSLFYSFNIEREKEKSLAISIIKILSDRNKLSLIVNNVARSK